ncbi:MAG: hypothetical protein M1569_03865 [Candidatus Marsarchaeota archaeon]|nr:hypothetical protein [Candidatus Marsarchaeota archaeon]
MADLVSTGVAGLDAMLYGGIPKNNQVIVAGGPGTGKTLLSFEFLYRNAKVGNRSIFFSLEEDPERVIDHAKSAFHNLRDIDRLIEDRKLVVSGMDIAGGTFKEDQAFGFGKVVAGIEKEIEESKAVLAVLDSSSALELMVNDPAVYRRSMWALVANLRRLGVTSVFTSEIRSTGRNSLEFRHEHFIFDGMLVLYQSIKGAKRTQLLEVIKMRGHRHSFATAPYEIMPGGFAVQPMGLNRDSAHAKGQVL